MDDPIQVRLARYRETGDAAGLPSEEVVAYAAQAFHRFAHMVVEGNNGLQERGQGIEPACGPGIAASHWTLAMLTNPFVPGSDEVIDLILLRRAMNLAQMATAKGEMHG